MRRNVTGLLAVGLTAAVALVGCSSGGSGGSSSSAAPSSSSAPSSSTAAPTSSSAPAPAPTDPATVLAQANIDSVIAAYPGDVTKLPKEFGPAQTGALKVGWSAACIANELNARLTLAIEKEVKAAGGTYSMLDANCDAALQVTQMQQLVNDKVDAIIVWPLDATALQPVVAQAKAAGIPVLAVEANPDGAGDIGDITGQVIYGRDIHAYVAATLMSQLFPGGEVATGKFAVPVPSINYYAERAAYWAEKDGLKVVGSFDNPSDNIAGGEQMAGPMLSKNPNLVGLLAYNDATAIGAMSAAKAAGRTLTAFANNGEDAGIEAVANGTIAMTIQPPLLDWAKQLVAGSYLAHAGTTIPKAVFTGVGNVITAETVANAKTHADIINAG